MQQHESILGKWEPEEKNIPLLHIPDIADKPNAPPPRGVEPLWRCHRCKGGIRTYDEIKSGKRLFCKCGSNAVVPAWPHWWEVIVLFFRTGTIFLAEKGDKNVYRGRRY